MIFASTLLAIVPAASELFDAIRQKCKLVAEFPNMGKRYERLSPTCADLLLGII